MATKCLILGKSLHILTNLLLKNTDPISTRNVPLVVLFLIYISCRLPSTILVTIATKSIQFGNSLVITIFASFENLVVMTTRGVHRKQKLYDGIRQRTFKRTFLWNLGDIYTVVSEKNMFKEFPNFKHLVAMTTIKIHVNK